MLAVHEQQQQARSKGQAAEGAQVTGHKSRDWNPATACACCVLLHLVPAVGLAPHVHAGHLRAHQGELQVLSDAQTSTCSPPSLRWCDA